MRYSWLDDYLMDKLMVTKDFKIEWNWIRYFIGGKMFAAVLLDKESKPYYINLKLEPLEEIFGVHNMKILCQDTTQTNSIGIQLNRMALCQMSY